MYPIQVRNPRTREASPWAITAHEGERYRVEGRGSAYAWVDGSGTAYAGPTGGYLHGTWREDGKRRGPAVPAYVLERVMREGARDTLRSMLKPGDTVTTILRHVSASGMSRRITLAIPHTDAYTGKNGIRDISRLAAHAAGLDFSEKRWQVVMGGCGMDMGFSAVYNLSSALFRDAFECIGEGCPSNDHSNGDRDYTPHMHSDAGYALNQRWL